MFNVSTIVMSSTLKVNIRVRIMPFRLITERNWVCLNVDAHNGIISTMMTVLRVKGMRNLLTQDRLCKVMNTLNTARGVLRTSNGRRTRTIIPRTITSTRTSCGVEE